MVITFGLMDVNILVSGNRIKCMGTVYFLGLMESDMKASIIKIKRKDMVCFTGQMVANMKAAGKMVNSMALEPTHLVMELSESELGKMAFELHGSMKEQL